MRLPLLVVTAALALLPAALAANSMEIAPSADFSELALDARARLSGSESAGMRSAMDSTFLGGNGDGMVSQAEVEAFAARVKDEMGSGMADSIGDNVTVDGNAATEVTDVTLDILDGTGAVTSTGVMTMRVTATIQFPEASGTTHTLFWQASAEEGNATIEVTVTAPAGYIIRSVEGLPEGSLAADKRSLRFTDSAANDQDATIVFAEAKGSKGSPAAGLAAVAVCVAAAFLVRARRN
jgi:hypothetical protein